MAEFGKNATQIMIFLPHYMWAENDNDDNSYNIGYYNALQEGVPNWNDRFKKTVIRQNRNFLNCFIKSMNPVGNT